MRHLVLTAFAFLLLAVPANAEILPHPAGCPSRAFCGCGVSARVYGHLVRDLYLARAWLRFPRSTCAAGNVAVFGRHHVAYIEACNGSTATLYDPNSGGHATRRHVRSIAGATIVDPNGNRATRIVSNSAQSPRHTRVRHRYASHHRRGGRVDYSYLRPQSVPFLDMGAR